MSLAPEVLELLRWDDALGVRLAGLSYPDQQAVVKAALDEFARKQGLSIAQVASTRDFEVPVDGGTVVLRVYTPPGSGPHPALLHMHGGGFVSGSIDWTYNAAKCAHVCVRTPCVVATVAYRLAPKHTYPTAPEDCYSALLWLVSHADELGVDPSRIAVGGESAGGNLAAVVSLMTRDRRGPELVLQVLEVPVTDMSDQSREAPSQGMFGVGYGLDATNIEAFTNAYLPNVADRSDAYASPLRASDLAGVAPAHVLTAEFDPLRDSGEAYALRLEEAGVTTTLHRFAGHTHGSSGLWSAWPPAQAWMAEVVAAIRTAVAAPASGA